MPGEFPRVRPPQPQNVAAGAGSVRHPALAVLVSRWLRLPVRSSSGVSFPRRYVLRSPRFRRISAAEADLLFCPEGVIFAPSCATLYELLPKRGVRPSRSGMERAAALSQIVTVVIRSRSGIPFESGPSAVFRDDRHEQIVAVQLQPGVCIHGFQPLKFRLLYLRPVPVIRYQRTILFGCLYVIM